MPTNNPTKADLQDAIDAIQGTLENVYQPETSREEMAGAIGDVLDQLADLGGEEEDEDEDDVDEDDDDVNGD